MTEVALGRKAGLFSQLPFQTYVRLPMGIVVQKYSESVKYCIIHYLSWPPGDTVNDHINTQTSTAVSMLFEQAVSLVKKHGVGTLMAKLDLTDAFKHILVHPEDWPLLCSSWDASLPDSSVKHQYHVDLFFPFGLCSSLAIFNQYADVLEFSMQVNGIRDLLHYLDDYFMAVPAGSGECQHNISTMVKVCRQLEFAVNPSQVYKPLTHHLFSRHRYRFMQRGSLNQPQAPWSNHAWASQFQTGQVSN